MGDWALTDGQRYDTQTISSSAGVTVTTSASTNTKGSYSTIVASTSFHAQYMMVHLGRPDNAGLRCLVDVAVGTAGNEKIIAADLVLTSGGAASDAYRVYFLPCQVPAGSTIRARFQSEIGSRTIKVAVTLFNSSWLLGKPLGRITTYGALTASSRGTNVNCGGTINTKGTYSQVTASTTNPCKLMVVAIGDMTNVNKATANFTVDVAIGAAASEKIIVPDLPFGSNSTSGKFLPDVFLCPVSLPSGVRLAARGQSTTNDATDRQFEIVLYGVD